MPGSSGPDEPLAPDHGSGGSSSGDSPKRIGASETLLRRGKSRIPLDSAGRPDVQEDPVLQQGLRLLKNEKTKFKEETQGYGWYQWLAYFLPCLTWLRTYNIKGWLLHDVLAGASVAAMVIPQGMSYAVLAGLPQVFGLYGAFVPTIVYALFGSSRQLAVGPVAVTSILLANGLADIPALQPINPDPNNPADPELQTLYNHAAIQVAFLAGVMYTGVGLLRLGWITYFLSHSVISGFMSGASIIIALSQVKYILGIKIPRADKLVESLEFIFDNLDQFKWREFCMGMAFIFLLLAFQWMSRNYRQLRIFRALGPLTVCVISIALMNIFDWYKNPNPKSPYIKNIGTIPKGLPPWTAGWFLPIIDASRQVPLAILICLVDICESISIAKALANQNKYQLDFTQELRGLGFANLAGALASCYTTTGSFSRSSVNNSVGAKTPLANFVTGMVIMLTLLVLTPVFTNMSQNVQGAIIIVGVLALFQWREVIFLWHLSLFDLGVWVCTFLFTIFLGVEIGIAVGVGVSLALVLYKTSFPRIVTIGLLPGSDGIYRNVALYKDAQTYPGIVSLRIDAPIFFANVETIKERIRRELRRGAAAAAADGAPRVRFVLLDLSPCFDVDATGIHMLADLIQELRGEGVALLLANPAKSVLVMLKNAQLDRDLGPGAIQTTVADAVAHAAEVLDEERQAKMRANV